MYGDCSSMSEHRYSCGEVNLWRASSRNKIPRRFFGLNLSSVYILGPFSSSVELCPETKKGLWGKKGGQGSAGRTWKGNKKTTTFLQNLNWYKFFRNGRSSTFCRKQVRPEINKGRIG